MRLGLAVILITSVILTCTGEAHYPRLRRPERLDTAEQISNYIKELQDYYSVHGRGRYGKRQMHIADTSVTFRETPIFGSYFDEDSIKSVR